MVYFGDPAPAGAGGAGNTSRRGGAAAPDPAAGLLSFNAPLARAMLGAEPGDRLPFAGEDDAIEVLAVAVPA